ncbi:hypothetical protein FOPE_05629 [Fonsecaea pedrosoi]|nr:hypothetical protein FOPE_05629 [Fonsecaea pedrosoi]
MGRSLERLAGEEPKALEGEETSDDEDGHPKSLRELMWVSCTPLVLFQWLFRKRNHTAEYDGIDAGEGTLTEPRISLSRMGPGNETCAVKFSVSKSPQPSQQDDGGLKILETEIDRISGESFDQRVHDDDGGGDDDAIRRIN